ncbi:hypothetical protein F8C76_02015 [Flagellimonas olearia]|uniref:Secreted protein n=1 Tax=Flagellimonas olearia TaxID=552546 RepID=A0A6I1DXP0_9FLAO|nr:DUF6520 family protein [Allomuricauda olearia]KAB7530306.1 hypothetical protein F8C76_02015 [Allomuricauda olearia]
MKTRAFKFLLPALAVIFAIAASAFTAIDEPMADDNTLIQGYYPTGNSQQPCNSQQVDCNTNGDYVCTIDEVTYYEKYNGTICHTELRKNNP